MNGTIVVTKGPATRMVSKDRVSLRAESGFEEDDSDQMAKRVMMKKLQQSDLRQASTSKGGYSIKNQLHAVRTSVTGDSLGKLGYGASSTAWHHSKVNIQVLSSQ